MMVKINSEYDINEAFKAIENELIASMIRNMERHKAEETKEGIQWSMWQAEQLKSLEKYRAANKKRFGKQFTDINGQIGELIRTARAEGNMSQEAAILKAIKDGFPAKKVSKGAAAEFFKLNDRKLNALIKATTNDVQRAETAILRMANDKYRKIIYNAQVYANTGAGTYEKAVDMTTKDMLSAGLNCVEYANGARHTLADYADMAIRTAAKRAYLTGEGEKRQEWGISTVIINKRGNPCPKCLPFVEKVLIDDVWSGGSRKDGPYLLMSNAIAAGLYHPRCKDSHTTYFKGISTPPDDKFGREELIQIEKNAKQESKIQYAVRQSDKFGRLAKYSLDGENQKKYQIKSDEWNKIQKNLFNDSQNVESYAAWDDLLGIGKDNEKLLNDIHTELNQHMKHSQTEKSVLFSLSGKTVLSVDVGTQIDEVILSGETMSLLKKSKENDIILSHTHPSDTSFSRADIDKLINYKSVKNLVVECPDGTKYVLDRGSYKHSVLGYYKYDKAFSDAEKEAQAMYPEFTSNNQEELEQIWSDYVDIRNKIVAEKLGLVYRKVWPDEK